MNFAFVNTGGEDNIFHLFMRYLNFRNHAVVFRESAQVNFEFGFVLRRFTMKIGDTYAVARSCKPGNAGQIKMRSKKYVLTKNTAEGMAQTRIYPEVCRNLLQFHSLATQHPVCIIVNNKKAGIPRVEKAIKRIFNNGTYLINHKLYLRHPITNGTLNTGNYIREFHACAGF